MAENFDDQRAYKRIPLTTKLRFRKMDLTTEGEHVIEHAVTNISGGGILVPASVNYPKGSLLQMEFRIPSRPDKVVVMGRVTWTSDTGMGVEFLKIDTQVRAEIVKNAKRGMWVDSSPELPPVKVTPGAEGTIPPEEAPPAEEAAEAPPGVPSEQDDSALAPPPPEEPPPAGDDALTP